MLFFLQEGYGVGSDAFFSSGEAEALCGGGFDAHLVEFAAHTCSHLLLHSRDVGIDFGTLSADGDIAIRQFITVFADEASHFAEQFFTVDTLVAWVGVGEMVADIAQAGSTEQRIAQRVNHHIGIAMTQ